MKVTFMKIVVAAILNRHKSVTDKNIALFSKAT